MSLPLSSMSLALYHPVDVRVCSLTSLTHARVQSDLALRFNYIILSRYCKCSPVACYNRLIKPTCHTGFASYTKERITDFIVTDLAKDAFSGFHFNLSINF